MRPEKFHQFDIDVDLEFDPLDRILHRILHRTLDRTQVRPEPDLKLLSQ